MTPEPLPLAAACARLRKPPGRPRTEPELRAAVIDVLSKILLNALRRDLEEHPITDEETAAARPVKPLPSRRHSRRPTPPAYSTEPLPRVALRPGAGTE